MTLKSIFAVQIVLAVFFISVWVGNAYKLSNCDFEAPYKCEALHGVGLIGPAAFLTVWFDSDKP